MITTERLKIYPISIEKMKEVMEVEKNAILFQMENMEKSVFDLCGKGE